MMTFCWQQPLPFKRTKREAAAIRTFLDDPDVQAVLKYIGGKSASSTRSSSRYLTCFPL